MQQKTLLCRIGRWCRCSNCLQSVVRPSTFLDLGSGMDCPKTLFQRRHLLVSGADLNPSSSSSHTLDWYYHLTVHLTL